MSKLRFLVAPGFVLLLIFIGGRVQAQDSSKTSLIPLLFYSPETKFGFGLAGVHTFQLPQSELSSQIQVGFAYTTLNQVLFYTPFEVIGEKSRLEGELGYYRFGYFYYGIGFDQAVNHEEFYEVSYPRLRLSAYKTMNRFNLGLTFSGDWFKMLDIEEESLLESQKVPGFEGMKYLGLGPAFIYDSRDNSYFPSSGFLISSQYLHFFEFSSAYFKFQKWQASVANYQRIGKGVFATEVGAELNHGDIPFVQLAGLGGAKVLRGYYADRFRERNSVYIQNEYRYVPNRVGFTVFSSLGWVYPKIDEWTIRESIWAGGAGFRYQFQKNRKLNLRLDMAVNQLGGLNFYFTVLEAF